MKNRLILATVIAASLIGNPAFAKNYTIKEVSDADGAKPYYFAPDKLTIQSGDTVSFVNAQDDTHDVMFVEVPKGVDEMIMSPMHEKAGDSFSYTFNIPGTYKFHCHPHEKLGMTGTLIVGTASAAGETVKIDHHHMAEHAHDGPTVATKSTGIAATGVIGSVDAAARTVIITHDPIKALHWPKMKMQFQVDSDINLQELHSGDHVTFILTPKGEDDYSISAISKN